MFNKYYTGLLFWLTCAFSLEIEVGKERLDVEVSATPESRAKGLSGRHNLPEGTGMLFIYEEPQICCFWMKDTKIPLSVGFFDANQTLIHWMEMSVPDERELNPTLYHSSAAALYALEVPKGWFTAHQIKPGAQLKMQQAPKITLNIQ